MPEETIRAYQDHGDPQAAPEGGPGGGAARVCELEQAGVDYDDVTDTLEREGVEKFSASFDELLDALSEKPSRSCLADQE